MTAETLNSYSAKDLAEMAKNRRVPGWHSMRKDQLIKALLKAVRLKSNKSKAESARSAPSRGATNGKSTARPAASNGRTNGTSHAGSANGAHTTNVQNGVASRSSVAGRNIAVAKPAAKTSSDAHLTRPAVPRPAAPAAARPAPSRKPAASAPDSEVAKKLGMIRSATMMKKDLAYLSVQMAAGKSGRGIQKIIKDRLVVMVRDPYWLQVHWELSRNGVERAQAALAQEWHTVKPILRLVEATDGGTTSAVETPIRDIEIHGGVNNWYVDVADPPKSYRIDIGYLTTSGRFYVLARSNVVTTPRAGSKDDIDQNWSDIASDFERIYAQSGGADGDGNGSVELQEVFEERLRRPMGSSLISRFGPGVDGLLGGRRPFHFEIDAELIVFGKTDPDAKVTLQNEPIKLRPDGTFTVRYSMPNARQVIPAVAASANGLEQRTVVLAVERNTKTMEPLIRDGGGNTANNIE